MIDQDGIPWFAVADFRKAVNLDQHGQMLDTLDADEKAVIRKSGNTTFRGHGLAIVSESGLYKLVMKSTKPEARAFQDWVTRDVLPSIRKDGAYVMGEEKVETGEMSPRKAICSPLAQIA